ncbi:acetoin utilization protein AcuC [Dictyoglomus thermophilum]|uniref:Acetoin utilization protein AcuC n=2 Tax=Dictyoglomus thermophilum TaxID=14 RepID=B5YBQ9_DICT6|nr:acetoin utilization protein AcuC [Dictyoglomus thermophilum]ACI19420.1 histone deacetylase superfamily [Dictyoglomus thermophilum H-6-12]MCX7720715.1 acetoin utilization protein AcuC [Dictyoglomus thermophilum]TYT24149.1 acetoin utilization protein AcuC [Dictyoglomus thermophilum]
MKKSESCIIWGEESFLYSFPDPHPMNRRRLESFDSEFKKSANSNNVESPEMASYEEIALFHTKRYIDLVIEKSKTGEGYLDYGDTPAFVGCYEAASYVVGSALKGVKLIMEDKYRRVFVPMAGLHHARRNSAGGFCIFNDIGVAVEYLRKKYGVKNILYVDIDAHHGDGVFYEYVDDPYLFIADVHEDGRFLYPGTGRRDERGEGQAFGTKLNIPLLPGAGDDELLLAFEEIKNFAWETKVEFIILQAGVDGISGDPITHLNYSVEGYGRFVEGIVDLANQICDGKIIILGGGGYNPENTKNGWMKVWRVLQEK